MIFWYQKTKFLISEIHIINIKNKTFFRISKIQIPETKPWSYLFISRMWYTYFQNLIFSDIRNHFFYITRFLKSDYDFWFQKCILYIRQIFYWYQEFESLKTENVLIFISRMWISDIIFFETRNHFLKSQVRILEIRQWFFISKMYFVYQTDFYWYQELEFLISVNVLFLFLISRMWFFDIRNSFFDITNSKSNSYFFISRMWISDI